MALQRLWPVALAVRLLVVAVLVAGPATDEPAELAGWDAERFQEIADRDGQAWVDQPVEYPPGSVVVLDRLAGADVVDTHRRLVVVSLLVDLAVAAALWRRVGPAAGRWFLVLGLPLVPLGYQRLDTLVTAVAVLGALALLAERGPGSGRAARLLDVVAGLALAVGALIKVWPAVLAVTAVALGRWRALTVAAVSGGVLGAAWLAITGAGLEPLDQVLSLRGATGWHVESLPGALVALGGDAPAVLELNAYRIGDLRPGLVTAGRVVSVVAMVALAVAGRRALTPDRHGAVGPDGDQDPAPSSPLAVGALTALGATAALLATAPLLSPQFLVWTTPWAALALAADDGPASGPGPAGRARTIGAAAVAGVAALVTGVTLTAFRPSGLDATVPAALLTGRNLALVAVPVLCLLALRTMASAPRPSLRPSGTTTGRPAGEPGRRPTPGTSGSADR